LVDRYVGETCVALCAGQPIPEWVLGALPGLPATMQASSQRANRFERAVIDLTEAITLAPRIGETFDGAIVELERDPKQGVAMLRDPAIEAPVTSEVPLPLGADVKLKLIEADLATRSVRFAFQD
jgi:exoribonuclease R